MNIAKRTALFEHALFKRFMARQHYQSLRDEGLSHNDLKYEGEEIIYWSTECDRFYAELNAAKWKDKICPEATMLTTGIAINGQ